MPQLFLSYAKENVVEARRLYAELTAVGISCWLDSEHIQPGQDWKVAIQDAISRSRFFLALLSESSVSKRGFVQRELRQAIEVLDEFPPSDIFIIPVRLEPCEPRNRRLSELQWVDLFEDYRAGVTRIARTIQTKLAEKSFTDEAAPRVTEDPTLSQLVARLHSQEPDVRVQAATQLRMLGSLAVTTVAELLVCLRDSEPEVRNAAVHAIASIGRADPSVAVTTVAELLVCLRDSEPEVRNAAAHAIASIDLAEPSVLSVVAQFPSLNHRTVSFVCRKLLSSGEIIPSLAPLLSEILSVERRQSSAMDRSCIKDVLEIVPLAGMAGLPILLRFLATTDNSETDEDFRSDVARMLATMGPAASPSIPLLLEALRSERKDVYKEAAQALFAIGPLGIAATVEDLQLHRSPDTAFAFYYFESGAEAAIPLLTSLLEAGMRAAAQGLGGIQSHPEAVVPVLLANATQPDPIMRRVCMAALGRFGPKAVVAVDVFIAALGDEDYYVRRDAAQWVGYLGPDAAAAIPALEKAEHDHEYKVRRNATRSLEMIRSNTAGV